jgi:hypothetical protein
MLQYIHDESLLRSEQIALTQQQNAEKHNELALSLQSKLKSITKDDITELRQEVGNIDSSLVRRSLVCLMSWPSLIQLGMALRKDSTDIRARSKRFRGLFLSGCCKNRLIIG